MNERSNLALNQVRLDQSEEWYDGAHGVTFFFVHRGKGRFASQKHSLVIGSGDVLMAKADLKGRVNALSAGGLKGDYFTAHLDQILPLLTSPEMCHLERLNTDFEGVHHLPAESPLAVQCMSLVKSTPPALGMEHRCHLLRVVAILLGNVFKEADYRGGNLGPSRENMLAILEELSVEELQSLSVEDLASRFNCGRRHLNRLFQEHFGTSVSSLKMEMRLLKAAALLRDPTLKVVYVAMECGFSHLGLFSTSFKKRFGMNPSAWRKELSSQSTEAGAPDVTEVEHVACNMRYRGFCPWAKGHPPIPPLGTK